MNINNAYDYSVREYLNSFKNISANSLAEFSRDNFATPKAQICFVNRVFVKKGATYREVVNAGRKARRVGFTELKEYCDFLFSKFE